MKRLMRVSALMFAFVLVGGACAAKTPKSALPKVHRGGTLRVAWAEEDGFPITTTEVAPPFLDPQLAYGAQEWELDRCCLARTLVATNGRATNEGGAELHPDLASRPPEISADGLAWTFSIKPGLKYAPPLQTIEITAQDFVRALQREAKIGVETAYGSYYSVIQGFDAYAKGSAASISGAQTPDTHTLVLHLNQVTGDLGYRLSLPAMSPIPPSPSGGVFGAAEGHDSGYGLFLVSSGPYMIKGSEALVVSKTARPLQGISKGTVTLVRNPSWTGASDPLRPAYVDQITVTTVKDEDAVAAAIDKGQADIALSPGSPPQAPVTQIKRYQADPSLGIVRVDRRDGIRYITINLAVPPFDDVHVRKAMNLVIDRAALVRTRGGPLIGDVVGHIGLDSSEQNLLVNYNPYQTPSDAGSIDLARAEMKLSRYDSNHDGLCDSPSCRGVAAYYFSRTETFVKMAPIVRRDAAKIGIKVDLHGSPTFFDDMARPQSKIPLGLFPGWGKDYLNASSFFEPLFSSSRIGRDNWSLTGASADQLRKWGYSVRSVPSVDDRIGDCLRQTGRAQVECWTALDQYLMETVVPWIPFLAENHIQVIPARIENFSYDQMTTTPALEQISLKP